MGADRGETDGNTADTNSERAQDRTRDTAPRAVAIAADTADLLAARAAALGISVSELVAALASGPNLPEPAQSDGLPPSGNAASGSARWREVKAWIDSWGKPDERPRPKLGK